MRDEHNLGEFHVVVGDTKLEEILHSDGLTYIMMAIFNKLAYGVEFVEEIKGHGAVETVSQKWPVCPYTVAVRNTSDKGHFATLYVDGQKVATRYVPARGSITFEGIPTDDGIQELLFSLPRFATLKERDIGGRALPADKTSELGTIKVVWRDCVKTGQSFENNYKSYGTASFKQANKVDAKATGDGAGGSVDAHASTTRAGKVVGLNESRACTVTNYQYVGEPWEAKLLYRTQTYLEQNGMIESKMSEEDVQERARKKARRRARNKARAEAEQGGAFVPAAAVIVDAQVPVDEE